MLDNFRAKLVHKTVLKEDLPQAWRIICNKLGSAGRDFQTSSMHPKKRLGEKWFHASSINDVVFIEKAKNYPENSKIKGKYHIYFPDFEITAKLYNEYASGVNCDIRHSGSHMTTYEITLIAELL
jgi:hypothetical protein